MKKVYVVATAVTLMSLAVANGQNLIVGLAASSGFYAPGAVSDASPALLDPSVNPSGQALLQLILAPSPELRPATVAGVDFLDPLDAADGARILVGNQTIGAGGSINPASEYANFSWGVPVQPFESGFLIARIFQGPFGDLQAGDLYYEIGNLLSDPTSPTFATENKPATASAQVVQMSRDLAFGFGDVLTLPIVPEPSSLLLLGVGAFGVVAARRRRNG